MGVIDVAPQFRNTTVQACGMYPFGIGDTHPMIGTPHGRNLRTGQTFCYDPVSATYRARMQNTPSVFVLGLPSFGKSTLARKLVAGEMAAARIPFVFADTKGEHVAVIEQQGGRVIRLGHGHGRLNPLALGALGSIIPRLRAAGRDDVADRVAKEVHARRKRLMQGLCEIERGSGLEQIERNVLTGALRLLDTDPRYGPDRAPLIADLLALIEDGPAELRRKALARDEAHYAEQTRALVATLGGLLDGELGDVFAGQTSTPLDLADTPPVGVVVDISALSASDEKLEAAVMYACWEDGFGAIEAAHVLADAGLAPQRLFLAVLDELWRVLAAGPGMVARIDALTRLTRTLATALLMITHTVKDLESLSSAFDVAKAKGFVERAGAVITGALPREEMHKLDAIVPFTAADKAMVSSWATPGVYDPDSKRRGASPGRGKFLLKIGTERVPGTPFQTVLTDYEIDHGWHDTDARYAAVRAA